jgi:hypothetical protein
MNKVEELQEYLNDNGIELMNITLVDTNKINVEPIIKSIDSSIKAFEQGKSLPYTESNQKVKE